MITGGVKIEFIMKHHGYILLAAFDYDDILQTLLTLKQGKKVSVPIYDFTTHRRLNQTETVYGADVIVFEGILAFCNKAVVDLMDLRIFVDTDDDVRLTRRLRRDIAERGRELHGVLAQYTKFVKPAFDEFIRPSMRCADLIIPRGVENLVAIDLITQTIQRRLEERGFFEHEPDRENSTLVPVDATHNFTLLDTHNTLSSLLHSPDTSRSFFIAESQPIIRRVIKHAMCTLKSPPEEIRAVSVVRAGVTLMEQALQEHSPSIQLGELLIHTSTTTGDPELHFIRLPHDIAKFKVVLLDPMLATGAAAMMAIRVLLDHEVPEENIYFLSLIVAPLGVHAIANAFPKVHMLAAEVDDKLNDNYPTLRGRFFGID